MAKFFDYLETSTQAEREQIAQELKNLYFSAISDELEAFQRYRENKRSAKARLEHSETVHRLAAMCDIFGVLGIDTIELDDEFSELRERGQA